MEDKKKKKLISFSFGKSDIVALCIFAIIILGSIISPKVYSVTTGLYDQGTEEDKKNVLNALGNENTEERFMNYFYWYNVVHELGHGLLYYNDGVKLNIALEEQLVNDFAVAYFKTYGDSSRFEMLHDIVNYAVLNVGTNYKDGVDYLELGKKNSRGRSFKSSFFNFNDYGWFQFSSVKHAIESDKTLEDVLKEMGFKDFKIDNVKTLTYDKMSQEVSKNVIDDAVENIRSWGLEFPDVSQHFDKDPNNNYSKPSKNYFWLFEGPDLGIIFG